MFSTLWRQRGMWNLQRNVKVLLSDWLWWWGWTELHRYEVKCEPKQPLTSTSFSSVALVLKLRLCGFFSFQTLMSVSTQRPVYVTWTQRALTIMVRIAACVPRVSVEMVSTALVRVRFQLDFIPPRTSKHFNLQCRSSTHYSNISTFLLFTDVDECTIPEASNCHQDANCINTRGSYVCRCKEGFLGDGKWCEGTLKYVGVVTERTYHLRNLFAFLLFLS